MTKRFCDKCGKEILKREPHMQAENQFVEIKFIEYFAPGIPSARGIDLCYSCRQMVLNWLKGQGKLVSTSD